MKRRLLLGVGISGLLSLAGCIGSLEDITDEGDEDDAANDGDDSGSANDDDDSESENYVHQKMLDYISSMEATEFRSAVDQPGACSYGRRVFSSPEDDDGDKHCLDSHESAKSEGIYLTQEEKTNHFSNVIRMFGTVITSQEEGDEVNTEHFSAAQAALLAGADFDADSIIILQQFTGTLGTIELENVGIVADESAYFVNFTSEVTDDDMEDARTVVILIEGQQGPDTLIAGQEKRDYEDGINGHAIWKS